MTCASNTDDYPKKSKHMMYDRQMNMTTTLANYISYEAPNADLSGTMPLVLLHGFCEDSQIWYEWLPEAWRKRTILIDLPGFGFSQSPEAPQLRHYAQAVEHVLLDLNVEKACIVGHSLGGYVALELASYAPHLVGKLGLFHSHPFPDSDERKSARTRSIELVRQGKKDLYVTQLFAQLFDNQYKADHAEIVQQVTNLGLSQSADGICMALEAMRERPDYRPILTNLECPVLFLLGRHDALIPVADTLATALLPRTSSVHVLDGVAHMGMFEAPEETLKIVEAFWKL
jgi:pimeloyl-ACP methyl ester carboxylesterase